MDPRNENHVAFMTPTGFIAIPESEAQQRTRALQMQVGVPDLEDKVAQLQADMAKLQAEMSLLTNAMHNFVMEYNTRNRKRRKF